MRGPDPRVDAELASLEATSRTRPLTWQEADRLANLIRCVQQRKNRRRVRERRRRAAIFGAAA